MSRMDRGSRGGSESRPALAFVGVVGSEESTADFTALGDSVSTAARLASYAGTGEILVSDATYSAAGLHIQGLEHRDLELKGKSEATGVHVLRADHKLFSM